MCAIFYLFHYLDFADKILEIDKLLQVGASFDLITLYSELLSSLPQA